VRTPNSPANGSAKVLLAIAASVSVWGVAVYQAYFILGMSFGLAASISSIHAVAGFASWAICSVFMNRGNGFGIFILVFLWVVSMKRGASVSEEVTRVLFADATSVLIALILAGRPRAQRGSGR
jgi:hypothetical protein